MRHLFLFISLLGMSNFLPESCFCSEPSSDKVQLYFREDWKESPEQIPVTQEHVQNPNLIVTRHGPDGDSIKNSHHDTIPNDPWYVWSGSCEKGRWAISLRKKNAWVDLSQNGKIRWRTKQSGSHILKVVLELSDGTWMIGEPGFGETPNWQVFEVELNILHWRKLNMQTIEAGKPVKEPDLSRVRSIGWTDLMIGEGSPGCTRVDWIEVYGKPLLGS